MLAMESDRVYIKTHEVRLTKLIRTWAVFSEAVKTLNEMDAWGCYVIEREGARRSIIMNRALSRYFTVRRIREKEFINSILKGN